MDETFLLSSDSLRDFFLRSFNDIVNFPSNRVNFRFSIKISSHVVISGFCNVGQYSFIGVNATLANNVVLGRDNWIGPNVALMKDTEEGSIYRTEQPDPAKISALRFFKVRE